MFTSIDLMPGVPLEAKFLCLGEPSMNSWFGCKTMDFVFTEVQVFVGETNSRTLSGNAYDFREDLKLGFRS